MDEETKKQGVDSAGAANQQDAGASAAVDGQQDTTQVAAGSQEETGQLEALKAEREKRQAAESERDQLQSQMLLLQNNAPQPTQAQAQKQQNVVTQVIQNLGYQDESYLTTEQQAEVMHSVMQIQQTTTAQQNFIANHPDYTEVVGKNLMGQFQIAPPLQRAITKNPMLGQALMSHPQGTILAYEIASKDPQYQAELAEKGKPPEQTAAEKAAEAITQANRQVSIGAVQGGGQVDQASAYANATNAEIAAKVEAAKAKV